MAGTQVLTEEGFKNIEDIQPGDYVYSTSDETGESGYKEVLEVFVKETEVITHVFYEIEENGQTKTKEIETTLNHRFWIEGEWKSAGTLKTGDLLTLADGTQAEVTEVTYEDRHETVYNMEVADYHTYYVGEDGIWVHNRYGQQGGTTGKGKKKSDLDVWDMPEGGGVINGREYSQHALERMAPDTPSVRAELSRRAEQLAVSKGLQVGTPEYYQFCQKYVNPRNIPPSVIEDAIRNTVGVPGNTVGSFVHETVDITVIVNSSGKVITVIPK